MIFHVDEFIQIEIASLKRILKIKKDIIYITNKTIWHEILRKCKQKPTEKIYGQSVPAICYIYIDLESCETLKEVKATICHELTHIKFPKANEKQIGKLTRNYID